MQARKMAVNENARCITHTLDGTKENGNNVKETDFLFYGIIRGRRVELPPHLPIDMALPLLSPLTGLVYTNK